VKAKAIISHEEPTVVVVEHPTHGLGEGIRRVDDPCNID
jgi:hypothetical protein